jgi:hypothetical protein
LVCQRGQALAAAEAVLVVAATSVAVTLADLLAVRAWRRLSPVVHVLATEVSAV